MTKPFPKCCPALFNNRFENVSMGKPTNPVGARRIRVVNNEIFVNLLHIQKFIFIFPCVILFIGCAIQYDPAIGVYPENPKNPCGPKNPLCDRYWTQTQTHKKNELKIQIHHDPAQTVLHMCEPNHQT